MYVFVYVNALVYKCVYLSSNTDPAEKSKDIKVPCSGLTTSFKRGGNTIVIIIIIISKRMLAYVLVCISGSVKVTLT